MFQIYRYCGPSLVLELFFALKVILFVVENNQKKTELSDWRILTRPLWQKNRSTVHIQKTSEENMVQQLCHVPMSHHEKMALAVGDLSQPSVWSPLVCLIFLVAKDPGLTHNQKQGIPQTTPKALRFSVVPRLSTLGVLCWAQPADVKWHISIAWEDCEKHWPDSSPSNTSVTFSYCSVMNYPAASSYILKCCYGCYYVLSQCFCFKFVVFCKQAILPDWMRGFHGKIHVFIFCLLFRLFPWSFLS